MDAAANGKALGKKMKLKKMALIAEIFGGIGIIVSILYLGFEVSQNTKNAEIANHLALVELNGAFRELYLTDMTIGALVSNGAADLNNLTDAERDRFYNYALHAFDLWETAFLINERDGLPIGTWELWDKGWCEWLRRPGFRELWESRVSGTFTERFRENVNLCFAT